MPSEGAGAKGAAGALKRPPPPAQPLSPVETVLTGTVCGALGVFARFIMLTLNDSHIVGGSTLLEVVDGRSPYRKPGQGVVTVSNHVSAVDDPGVLAAIMPSHWFFTPSRVRWTLCATDRCFRNPVSGAILRRGKVLPVERGRGLYQPMMDDVVAKLEAGEWVHMFPEGRRSLDEGRTMGGVKPGVARLIAEPTITPVVLPIVHSGMHHILRKGELVPVSSGHRLDIRVGDPINFDDLIHTHRTGKMSRKELHLAISERVHQHMTRLKTQLDADRTAAELSAGDTA